VVVVVVVVVVLCVGSHMTDDTLSYSNASFRYTEIDGKVVHVMSN